MTQDEIYDAADAIELVMESRRMGYGWTPSEAARKARVTTDQARITLDWMASQVYVTKDERGAWSKFYRRH